MTRLSYPSNYTLKDGEAYKTEFLTFDNEQDALDYVNCLKKEKNHFFLMLSATSMPNKYVIQWLTSNNIDTHNAE